MNHPAIKDGEREREGMREVVLVCVCEGGREERKSSTLLMISSPSLLLHAKHTLICPTDTHHKGVCVLSQKCGSQHTQIHLMAGQRQASTHSLYFTAVSKAL